MFSWCSHCCVELLRRGVHNGSELIAGAYEKFEWQDVAVRQVEQIWFVQKWLWSSTMSPYEQRFVDVKFTGGVSGFVTGCHMKIFHFCSGNSDCNVLLPALPPIRSTFTALDHLLPLLPWPFSAIATTTTTTSTTASAGDL
ncbi:hypothetical protein L1987_16836 [Smallanthus sonchifolius]|uniref:Uncharacterized protein n=1 Tax=Smallanthus sonchifolius TaxID=185202 RepID=A0ACB9IVU3_9ASTR|nr:hypothetical protein L1987_16836 [Smallanthus sonchifolius]